MAKYKVDDLVRAKFGGELWHILEATEQSCEGGERIQVTYLVRSYRKTKPVVINGVTRQEGEWLTASLERKVREMEIGYVIDDIPSDLIIG